MAWIPKPPNPVRTTMNVRTFAEARYLKAYLHWLGSVRGHEPAFTWYGVRADRAEHIRQHAHDLAYAIQQNYVSPCVGRRGRVTRVAA